MSLMSLLQKGKLERESTVRKKVAIAATVGVTVGAVAGVLLAPKAGKETRKDLIRNIRELPERAKELSDKTQELVGEVKEKLTGETQQIVSEVKEKFSEMQNKPDGELPLMKSAEIIEDQVGVIKNKLK